MLSSGSQASETSSLTPNKPRSQDKPPSSYGYGTLSLVSVSLNESKSSKINKMPASMRQARDTLQRVKQKLKARQCGRIFLAETMGTFILLMFGVGSVAQFVLGDGIFGSYLSVNMGWGFGVALGLYWSAGVSGGHINPAVTLAMTVTGRLKPKLLPVYWAAQSLGAFLASAVCYGVYKDALDRYDGGTRSTTGKFKTAGIWSTYPLDDVSNGTAFFDQVVGTALLVGTVFALTDKRNNAPKSHLTPLLVAILVWAIGMSFGLNCGYGINPARDLIPRIFTAIAGWGSEPFSTSSYWFWCPVIAQLIGGVLGAWIYLLTIEIHHEDDDGDEHNASDVSVKYTKADDEEGQINSSAGGKKLMEDA